MDREQMINQIYSALPILDRPKFVSMARNYFPEYAAELIAKRDEEHGNGVRTTH